MGDAEKKTGVMEEEESLASGESEETSEGEETQEEQAGGEEETSEGEGDVNEALRQSREREQNLNRRIDFLENVVMTRNAQPQQPKKQVEIDPEEPISGGKLVEVLNARDSQSREEIRQERIAVLESVARERYKDYDQVALKNFRELCSRNPGMYEAVMNSQNPPELAYSIGKTHPSYTAQATKKAAVSTAKKAVANSEKVATLAESGGKKAMTPKKEVDFDSMSDAEFDAYVAKVKNRQYK